ncbi:hypothetical protein H8K32_02885 [Undibacterium jejuense]|uniref:Uncharacterized protein n=1 Tax=Undibacterium jejuense TaxID=1344949 RepID=A0A923HER1_9BURK|nr:hypothetical protein [Undibacterium jejuense]MBC3861033.1 hypothetical protein [Undibacterium jejuense]
MTFLPQWLYNWLGLNFPAQRIPLTVILPLVKSTPLPVLNALYQLQKTRATEDEDVQFLRLILKNLKQLNRCDTSITQREEYNHRLAALFYPLTQVMVGRFGKDGGVPDSQVRAQTLDTLIAICTEFASSYGVIIQYYQQCSRFRYARSLKKLDLAALRLFEFLKMEQSIKGLRYQELSEKSWAMANTLIHILAASERLSVVLKPLDQTYSAERAVATTRAVDVYLSIQMSERLQLSFWPVQWQSWLQRSIGLGDLKIGLSVLSEQTNKSQVSFVYCYDPTPSSFTPKLNKTSVEPLLLQWDQLQQSLTSDFAQVLRSRQSECQVTLSKHLSLFHPNEQLALAQLQFDRFNAYPIRTAAKLDQEKEVPDLRIFIGFKDVFALLRHIASGGTWKPIGQRMTDLLARHSAVFSDDADASVESTWSLRHQDNSLICLSSLESRHTTHMHIGDLAACMLEQSDWHQPKLCVIQRILRPQAGRVYVEMQVLSEQSEAIFFESQVLNQGNLSTDPMPGNELVQAIRGKNANATHLILPRGVRLMSEGQVTMNTKNGMELAQLGHIMSATKSFSMYALRRSRPIRDLHGADRVLA